jgi:hypothetical protein
MTREQVFVHHKNPYSLSGFEPPTSGLVVWSSDQLDQLLDQLATITLHNIRYRDVDFKPCDW